MAETRSAPADPTIRRLAWATLAFTVAVILGGSVVRATDSGAGCGESWPRCQGHIIPWSAEGATVIEFTHRAMTFALGLSLVALVLLVVRRTVKGDPVRRALRWTVIFFFGEVIIGAFLVIFGWVEDDASVGRAIAVTVHLVNTFLLLGALALTAHVASGRPAPRVDLSRREDQLIGLGVLALLVVGASGALNALADTLYPAASFGEGLQAELGADAPGLLRLRVAHPMIAVAGAGMLFMLARAPSLQAQGRAGRLSAAVQVLIGVQLVMGIANVALLTPVEAQVTHLLLADLLWICWVLFGAEFLGAGARVHEPVGEAV